MIVRPYRFPPLAQLMARAALPPQDLQAALAGGFQEGQQRGYHEGHAQGLQRAREEGHAAGHAEGLRVGAQHAHREVLAHFEGLAAPVDALVAQLHQAQAEYQQALRKELVDLVARVAKQVIRCELALQPVQLLALVDETLDAMPAPHKGVEVHLNADDLARIREVDPVRAKRWTLIADAQLEPGECRVRTEHREADAGCRQRLAACMEQVSQQLLEPESRANRPALAYVTEAVAQDMSEPAPDESAKVMAEAITAAEARDVRKARTKARSGPVVPAEPVAPPPAPVPPVARPVKRAATSRGRKEPA